MKTIFLLREVSEIAYGDGFEQFPNEKDLLRSHLVVELIEHYHYAPEAIGVGVYVPVKNNGVEYAELDIVVHDTSRQPFILATVELPQTYEQNLNEAMRKLFAIAVLMREKKAPHYLMYYTRWYEGEHRKIRHIVVDYSKRQTFSAWHSASRPTLPDIPANPRV